MTTTHEQALRFEQPELLRAHPLNPRKGDVERIRESIRKNGFRGAAVGQQSSTYIIAGAHRVQAAAAEGLERVPVLWVDVDDERALSIMLADNRTSDEGNYEVSELYDILDRLEGLEGTAYSGDDLDDLLVALEGALVAPEQEFRGGYAETDEERTARQAVGGTTRRADGIYDVVLTFTTADFARFRAGIKRIRGNEDLTTADCVMRALEACTK